jgi:hypothetical protein
MKISEETITVLNNFSTINPAILVKKGNVLRTVAETRNVFAEAYVSEKFSTEFAIYNLGQFLNAASLLEDTNYSFTEKSVVLTNGDDRTHVEYRYCDPTLTPDVPEKGVAFNAKDVAVEFELSRDDLQRLLKASGVLQLPHLRLVVDGKGKLKVYVTDEENVSGTNLFCLDIGDANVTVDNSKAIIEVSNLKIIPDDYTVSISSKGIARFESHSSALTYWIAVEAKYSKFSD